MVFSIDVLDDPGPFEYLVESLPSDAGSGTIFCSGIPARRCAGVTDIVYKVLFPLTVIILAGQRTYPSHLVARTTAVLCFSTRPHGSIGSVDKQP
jgi:hypothetical protein